MLACTHMDPESCGSTSAFQQEGFLLKSVADMSWITELPSPGTYEQMGPASQAEYSAEVCKGVRVLIKGEPEALNTTWVLPRPQIWN